MADEHDFTLRSAEEAANTGRLATWVAELLAPPGRARPELARALAERPDTWLGPMPIPLDLLAPSGPPEVIDLADRVDLDEERPPPIVSCRGGRYRVEDGDDQIESQRRSGAAEVWCLVHFDDIDELNGFLAAGRR